MIENETRLFALETGKVLLHCQIFSLGLNKNVRSHIRDQITQ